ncbi:MAG TPA: NAD(P) transhydrogenase subunit alpha [Spirochaetota bacterium]|jgi:NAD(P) transhydrogenase subunit alpha|nr:NAD(P) transhydrogenase subunit alpha [Spirochaetota bacterium]HOM88605.1 NAD(P) transhydrogenase subunit alpha [Spirochaetota bacterium]HPD05521.1 NAD(P) transhydrogenase subunit alpha [Spirochaetota bacterium]HQG43712.1 NAD(P) transhydrogenase subunit alpha [Spirochaetota bacterium]HQI37856.1 NAD(P) transhydrogenase subunit alpha [Spirochaetota bacterium]
MNNSIMILIFIISTVAGYKLIKDVPSLLHTPLMSGMNAFSGITVIGAIVTTASAAALHSKILGAIAIILAMINVVGGFYITDRMLGKFKSGLKDK